MDILQFILDHAAKEWNVIRSAPGASFILFGLAFTVLWIAFKWRYEGQIELLIGQNNLLKDQVADFRERLNLVPADSTAYSKLTNEDLKASVAAFLVKLKEFARRSDKFDGPTFSEEERQALAKATTVEEKQKISHAYWTRNTAIMSERSNARNTEYQQNFRAQATVFRDEMMRRLPPETTSQGSYEIFAGPYPAHAIATDLERLSTLLPTRKSRQ